MPSMNGEILYQTAQKRLMILWVLCCCALLLLWFTLTFTGRFDNIINDAWGWLLPNILPTLSLILGVYFYQVNNPSEKRTIDKMFFLLSFYISLFYFLVLFAIILSYRSSMSLIEYYRSFNVILGPLQGIVSIPIGIFFFRK